MAGFNRLALESNSIYGLLKDVHKIGRCHTNKKMELVNSENNNLLKNNILSILICKIQLLFQCKSLL